MIDRPKRAVTRFFVPLIDVLILLFCIFLLMPFVASSGPEDEQKTNPKDPVEELPKDVRDLQDQLTKAREAAARLKAERENLVKHLSVRVLEIDPKDGRLFYLQDGSRVEVTAQPDADRLITQHRRASGTRDLLFLILYPRQRSGYPEQQQADDYARWFKDVQFQFDRPFAPQ
jgi:hypothetical protein